MGTLIQGFLDNDSFFGKMMTKAGIIIGANLMFLLFSIPVITIGPGLAALYYVMLKTLHGDGVLNPFTTFWKGFKMNFKQGLISWIVFLLIAGFVYVDYRFCNAVGGVMTVFKYGVCVVALIVLLIFAYLLPVMAAFSDTLPHLIRNAVFFICKRPLIVPVILFFDVFPLYLTYSDPQYLPLYAFLWCIGGFGAIAMIGAACLHPLFKPFLAAASERSGEADEEEYENKDEDEEQMLRDLRAMDGL